MPSTPQDRAVAMANRLIDICTQLDSVYLQAQAWLTQYGGQSVGSIVSALPTCAITAAGTLGTADGSPVGANVIDTRVITGLTKAVSANALGGGVTALTQLQNMMGGSAVTTATYRTTVEALSM